MYKCGHLPFAPHLFFPQFLSEDIKRERDDRIKLGLKILEMCDEIWVIGDEISSGMGIEIGFAEGNGIPIIYFKDGQFSK